ncbi:iron complex transport system permease protein [Planomicrobium koreense]|uniref:Iron complex transport system permease protein n=1 Tax=Planococcus koreensis TaxID=112331 RepID=A0A7W8CRT7_9BACL|nr:iron ABC transporter permease [Planococcus koreensis]MBB5180381.1 iron complex transport system permease protein [Planococcus koreensis]
MPNQTSFFIKIAAGAVAFAAMFVISIAFGAADISLKDTALALFSNASNDAISVIREIRLPRELAAVLVGAALAVSGAIMQGMTRNPLADPGLLGLTAGANAALAITLAFIPAANYFGIMIACFIGAAVGAALVFGLGSVKRGGFSPFRIVLAGAAISAFLSALAEGIGIYFKISKDVSMWTAGGLIGTTWGQLKVISPFIAVSLVIALLLARQLSILSLSEEAAIGLGQKTMQTKALLFVAITMLAGAAVALAGNMAFVGLLVPHIVRAIVGVDYRHIIPMSAIAGAIFMLFADLLGRTINAPFETPVAAIVAMLGLPFFLLIVRKGGGAFT